MPGLQASTISGLGASPQTHLLIQSRFQVPAGLLEAMWKEWVLVGSCLGWVVIPSPRKDKDALLGVMVASESLCPPLLPLLSCTGHSRVHACTHARTEHACFCSSYFPTWNAFHHGFQRHTSHSYPETLPESPSSLLFHYAQRRRPVTY